MYFYNIDMIEHKYKQYRYKTIPEISKYIKNEIFELKKMVICRFLYEIL